LQFDVGAAAKCVPQPEAWDKVETKALLEFLLFYWTSDAWPRVADFAEKLPIW